jgi:zinc finger SWIM domain-containing protein 3
LFGRPFAPFIGVYHYKQTVILSAALLHDKYVELFKWLFRTFLSAVSGKQSTTILIDQFAAMAKSIDEVFPKSHHHLCV